jgi:wyosine [tRNA(Phe)-imidazoG37] synthetase (radical SAM superfamily)
LDCIYCQLGRTPKKTVRSGEHFSYSSVLAQINKALTSGQKIDHITFSGSGEPTLNANLGKLIREIKKITDIPVAVLTNATLLTAPRVRKALQPADLVIPSLDAATQEEFIQVNRPHVSLKIDQVILGLKKFRQEFKGQIWLEIMLVKGKNDSSEHIKKLKSAVEEIQPDKIQLNTVIRPPAEKFACALSLRELERIKKILGNNCEIIADFSKRDQSPQRKNLEDRILSIIQRRPVTLLDISTSIGKNEEEISKYLNALIQKGFISRITHKGRTYYEPKISKTNNR